jgi:hypothetical protein
MENMRKKSYWWNSGVEELIQEKQSKYEKWLATHEQEDREQYVKISREVKRAATRAKDDSWERKRQEIEYFSEGTKTKMAWKTIRDIRQENQNKLNIQMIKMDEWVRYYSEMLTENRHKFQNIPTDTVIIGNAEEITIDETKRPPKK